MNCLRRFIDTFLTHTRLTCLYPAFLVVLTTTIHALDCPFDQVPTEIKRHIFSCLDTNDLARVAQTNRDHNLIANNLFQDQKYLSEKITGRYIAHFKETPNKKTFIEGFIIKLSSTPLKELRPQMIYILAYAYDHGIVLKADNKAALTYYDKAADLGHQEALMSALNYYKNGYAGTPNHQRAKELAQRLPQDKTVTTIIFTPAIIMYNFVKNYLFKLSISCEFNFS